MPLNDKLNQTKCVTTVWGKLIPEREAYSYALRHIAAFTANIFQVMRILEPDFNKRTEAICETSYMFNMSACSDDYKAAFYGEWNIPEFCDRCAWLGGIVGDSGDEYQNMAGRVIQFTRDRVEKELDACPWDIVGAELCNMTTAMFTANFDIESAVPGENEVSLNMCEARGCGGGRAPGHLQPAQAGLAGSHGHPRYAHSRYAGGADRAGRSVHSERLLFSGLRRREVSGMGLPLEHGKGLGLVCCLPADCQMADTEEEFERIFKIVFATAGKNEFIEPFAKEGLRSWLGVPHEIGWNDPRLMGGYIKNILDTQFVPSELDAFTKDEVRIKVNVETFTGRFEMAPIDELILGYETLWHNMVKTLVSPEWSCWFEDKDEEEMTIVVGRKIDKRMV